MAKTIEQVKEFVSKARDENEWQVQFAEETVIPFLQYPTWIVTTAYLGRSPHVKHRLVRDLVVEKDFQLHMFDVTELIHLNQTNSGGKANG